MVPIVNKKISLGLGACTGSNINNKTSLGLGACNGSYCQQ